MYIENWLNSETGNKKVLITNNMKNAVRALRKCNNSGVSRFNTECKSIRDIAFEVIAESIASEGKIEKVNIIDDEMCGLILNEIIINNIEEFSFLNPMCISQATADEILRNMNKIRSNSTTEAYDKSSDTKISELKKLISLYEKRLSDENKYDYCSALKKAISVLENKCHKKQTSYGLFKSYSYTRLEMEFVSRITGGECPVVTHTEKTPIKCSLFKSYGIGNEISYVADKINENKMPFGSVNLFYTCDEYESFIKGILGSRGIPVRFIKEYSALDTNIISFMYSVIKWADDDFIYSDIEQIVLNPVFEAEGLFDAGGMLRSFISNGLIWGLDRYKAFADKKRAETDKKDYLSENQIKRINSFLDFICDMADVFEGYENISKLYDKLYDFTMKYTRNRNSERKSAVNVLKKEKGLFREINGNYNMKEAVRIIKGRIESMKIKDEESTDAVNAIKLNSCEIIERKYNFIIGLSARQFNSNVTESPVMTDSEIIKYIRGNRQLAVNVNRRKERALMDTLRSGGEGTEIYAGYIYYDTVNAIMTSPANVFIKLAGDENNIETAENKGIINKNIITESSDKVWGKFESNNEEGESKKSDENIKTVLSATKVKELFNCPLSYFYKYVERLEDENFIERNSGVWLDPLGKGNLTHAVLERYVKKELMNNKNVSADINEDLFNEVYESAVEEYKEKYQYDTEKIFLREKEEIRDVIYSYIKKLHDEMSSSEWMVIGCEEGFENVEYRAESWGENETIAFKGTIDRTDVNKDNKIRIIDYKSSTSEDSYRKDDYKQHIIYPMAKENVEKFMYEYLFLNKTKIKSGESIKDFSEEENKILKNTLIYKKY